MTFIQTVMAVRFALVEGFVVWVDVVFGVFFLVGAGGEFEDAADFLPYNATRCPSSLFQRSRWGSHNHDCGRVPALLDVMKQPRMIPSSG